MDGDRQSCGKVSSVLSANQKQQTMLRIVMKGKQDKRENIIMPFYKSTVHLPLGNCLQFWTISEAQKSRRDGQESSIASVRGMSKLAKAPQPDQEMARGLGDETEIKEPASGIERADGDCLCDVSSNTRTRGHQMKLADDTLKTRKKKCFFAQHRAELWKLLL